MPMTKEEKSKAIAKAVLDKYKETGEMLRTQDQPEDGPVANDAPTKTLSMPRKTREMLPSELSVEDKIANAAMVAKQNVLRYGMLTPVAPLAVASMGYNSVAAGGELGRIDGPIKRQKAQWDREDAAYNEEKNPSVVSTSSFKRPEVAEVPKVRIPHRGENSVLRAPSDKDGMFRVVPDKDEEDGR